MLPAESSSRTHWTNHDLLLVLLGNRSANSVIDAEAVDILSDAKEMLKHIPRLHPEDAHFFHLVQKGKIREIKASENFGLSGYYQNKLNEQGDTVWHVAVYRQDVALLKLLLPEVEMDILYDLLLHATQTQNVRIVRLIWHTAKKLIPDVKFPSELPPWHHSQYTFDTTPLFIAAKLGNYRLIKYFHDIGERFVPAYIELPSLAISKKIANDMVIGYAKLHEYEALASPELICYKTMTDPEFDPILVLFNLHHNLDKVRIHEHELEHHYEVIQDNIERFLQLLIDLCRSTKEMRLILMQKEGYVGPDHVYPRLMLAIQRGRIEFVTHRNCQKVVYMLWAGDNWPEWQARSNLWKLGCIIVRCIFLPFICIWIYFDTCSKSVMFLRAPVNRFLNELASDVYFLLLLAYEAISLTDRSISNVHDTPNKTTEIMIMVIVFGHSMETFKHWRKSPAMSFFKDRWNCFELLIILVFLTTFICWGITWYTEWVEPTPRKIGRLWWSFYDPVVLGETTFAISLVLYYGTFLRFLQIHKTLGPLQLKLTSLFSDIFVFFFFFLAAVCCFSHSLYFIYNPLIPYDKTGSSHYSSFLGAFYTVLSGMLHKIDSEIFEQEGVHIGETVGKFLWMIYYLVGTTILVLMFLAYAVFKFRDDDDDTIWRWNRTKVWLYYTLQVAEPSPFNLIPRLQFFAHLGRLKHCSFKQCCQSEIKKEGEETKSYRHVHYHHLMVELMQRYLRSKVVASPPPPAPAPGTSVSPTRIAKFKQALQDLLNLNSELNLIGNDFENASTPRNENLIMSRSDSKFNMAWILNSKPLPSPMRQDFTPPTALSRSSLK